MDCKNGHTEAKQTQNSQEINTTDNTNANSMDDSRSPHCKNSAEEEDTCKKIFESNDNCNQPQNNCKQLNDNCNPSSEPNGHCKHSGQSNNSKQSSGPKYNLCETNDDSNHPNISYKQSTETNGSCTHPNDTCKPANNESKQPDVSYKQSTTTNISCMQPNNNCTQPTDPFKQSRDSCSQPPKLNNNCKQSSKPNDSFKQYPNQNNHTQSQNRNMSTCTKVSVKQIKRTYPSGASDRDVSPTRPMLQSPADDNERELEEGAASDTSHSGLPIDRGWAWVVMMAHFLICFMMMSYNRTLAIFILEFTDMFNVPVTTTTTAIGLMAACFGFGNLLVSNFFLSRYSTRTIMVVGGTINAGSVALTCVAPDMLFVTITHCFIGFSHALIFVPGVTVVSEYFDKRRSFAMAVTNTGLSFSALIAPPLTEYLIASYGARGALLLVAGMEMQILVAISLMKPLSWFKRSQGKTLESVKHVVAKQGEAKLDDKNNVSKDADGEDEKRLLEVDDVKNETDSKYGGGEDDTGCVQSDNDDMKQLSKIHSIYYQDEATTKFCHKQAHPEERYQAKYPHHIATQALSRSMPEDSFLSPRTHSYSSETALHISNARNTGFTQVYTRQQSSPSDPSKYDLHHRQLSTSLNKVSDMSSSILDVCGSTVSVPAGANYSEPNHREESDKVIVNKRKGMLGKCMDIVTSVIDLSLFKNWLFILIICHVPLGLTAGFISFYFPSLGVGNGLARQDAALLMTVAGGVDLFSRLGIGYLADLQIIRRTHIVIVSLLIIGITCQFCSYYDSFGLLVLLAVVFGLVGGVCSNLFVVVIIDLMGPSLLGKVMGLVLVFNALFAALIHVIIGALVDMTGSFVTPYNFIGTCLILSALVLMMEPLARSLQSNSLLKRRR